MRVECVTGSYTLAGGRPTGSDGICRVIFDTESPGSAEIQHIGRARNPSYLCPAGDGPASSGPMFWAVEELPAEDAPKLLLFSPGHGLDAVRSWPLKGTDACHVAQHGNLVAVAQYGSGTVALFDTESGGACRQIVLEGRGPHPVRQASSHAHQAVFLDDGKRLSVTDLGGDALCFYDLDGGGGPSQVLRLPPGSGPRHVAVSNDETTIFVACELDETVHVIFRNGDKYESDLIVPLGGQAPVADGALSAIRLSHDGRHLYVAMRRQNMIALLTFDQDRQTLTPSEYTLTGGIWPRDIALTGQGSHLLIANQHSGSLTVAARNEKSGVLTLLPEKILLPGVSCIMVK